jgi:hypothetical protein
MGDSETAGQQPAHFAKGRVMKTDTRATKIPALRSACTHIAQSRLLILREAIETRDPDLELDLRDMAGILEHVLAAIEQLEATR